MYAPLQKRWGILLNSKPGNRLIVGGKTKFIAQYFFTTVHYRNNQSKK